MNSRIQNVSLQNRLQQYFFCATILFFLGGGFCQRVIAEEVTSQYFKQLRRRHLFSLAEGYCLTQLKKENLSSSQRSQILLELSRTFVEHANNARPEEQAELWKRAESVLSDELQKNPQLSGRLLLDIQIAKIPAAVANWYRWEYHIAPENKASLKKAIIFFNQSISRWQQLQKHFDERLKITSRRKKKKGAFSSYELRGLLKDVYLQHATARLDYAELLPFKSDARKQQLYEAEMLLQKIKNGSGDKIRTWQSRLQLARAGRLRHRFKAAAAVLRLMKVDKPPHQILSAFVEEKAHLFLAWNKPLDALKLLSVKRRAGIAQTGELRYLNLQSLIASAKLAEEKKESKLAAEFYLQVEIFAKRTVFEMGGFWGYRCQKLLHRLKQNQQYTKDVAHLVRQAQVALAANQNKKAMDLFKEAIIAAMKNNKKTIAMELGFRRASIQLQSKDNKEAAISFMELATHFPQSKLAADAHLLGSYALGRVYLESKGSKKKSHRQAYKTALKEHLQKYATHPSVTEAKWMYAVLQEEGEEIAVALKWYLQIPTQHKRGELAQVAVARCYQFLLNRDKKSKRSSEEEQQQMEQIAVTQLTKYVKTYSSTPRKLSGNQADVLLRLAQIELHRQYPDFAQVDRWLLRLIASSDTQIKNQLQKKLALATWKTIKRNATQLRILSLAGQKKYHDAKQLVEQLAQRDIADVLHLLEGLGQVAASFDKTTRIQIGQLQLQAAKELYHRPQKLSGTQQQQVEQALAEAYVATNDFAQAREFYLELIKKSPKNHKILKRFALLSQQCGTKKCLNDAKKTWRKLGSLEKPGTVIWLQARYHLAECYLLLGETKECRKLLTITKILYPQLGNKELRQKFIALQKKAK